MSDIKVKNFDFQRELEKVAAGIRKPNILICKIYRSGRLITPSGSDWIEAGDSVVLTALSREKLKNIEDILES